MQKVKCVRAVKVFRVDYEPDKVYEVDDELAARLLKHVTQIGPSNHRCFVAADGEKKTASKKATRKTAKKATKKKAKRTKKSTKRSGPKSPMTA